MHAGKFCGRLGKVRVARASVAPPLAARPARNLLKKAVSARESGDAVRSRKARRRLMTTELQQHLPPNYMAGKLWRKNRTQ